MPGERPIATIEPSSIMRIPRPCTTPGCGAVFYVAHVADAASCPRCSSARSDYRLSA